MRKFVEDLKQKAMAVKIDNLKIQVFNLDALNPLDCTKDGREIELGVQDDLELGEYLLDLKNKLIYNINDLNTPYYKFEIV